MTPEHGMIFAILAAAMGLFLWGRFRHDVVALGALIAAVLAGLVPSEQAFAGFGHPAVITVACILVLSAALQQSGAVDVLARTVLPATAGRLTSMLALMGLGAVLSAFMNNVGAMALLMPVAVQLSDRLGLTAGQVLMPLAFGTILGGMTTLVGTPPNLIVSGFRADAGLGSFAMFDFAPVGVAVAGAGIVFVAVIGWRLVPARVATDTEGFETGSYFTEARVPEKAKAIGMTLRQVEAALEKADVQIVALVRDLVRLNAPDGRRKLRAEDVLVLEADVEGLGEAVSTLGLRLLEQAKDAPKAEPGKEKDEAEEGKSGPREDDVILRELAVLPGSTIVGRSAKDMHLRTRFGLNLLAVARAGRRPRARLRSLKMKSGDLLLMQGPAEAVAEFIEETGCVPLGARELRLPDPRRAILATAIIGGAIVSVAFGLLTAAVAFALGVVATMALRTMPLRKIYTSIDWPVVVLLAALIPVAGAMQATGAADLIATVILDSVAQGNAIAALAVILMVTMFLSDVMNNAATAAVMSPIALGIANSLGAPPDSFLMAVAIGASCAFLTPIGHQNNTLILGPGGFGFGDYWRLGLPLEAVVVAVSLPLLVVVWGV